MNKCSISLLFYEYILICFYFFFPPLFPSLGEEVSSGLNVALPQFLTRKTGKLLIFEERLPFVITHPMFLEDAVRNLLQCTVPSAFIDGRVHCCTVDSICILV